jgi:hypothetical protein
VKLPALPRGASVTKQSGTAPKPSDFALRATSRSPLAIFPRACAGGMLAEASEVVSGARRSVSPRPFPAIHLRTRRPQCINRHHPVDTEGRPGRLRASSGAPIPPGSGARFPGLCELSPRSNCTFHAHCPARQKDLPRRGRKRQAPLHSRRRSRILREAAIAPPKGRVLLSPPSPPSAGAGRKRIRRREG